MAVFNLSPLSGTLLDRRNVTNTNREEDSVTVQSSALLKILIGNTFKFLLLHIAHPPGIYIFKVNNKNTRIRREICP